VDFLFQVFGFKFSSGFCIVWLVLCLLVMCVEK